MKKIISKLLLMAILVCTMFTANIDTKAAEVKAGETRAIYVVFDNSGSMYGPGNKAWSQAIYAMEVFAAMMNFDSGDQMKIFPMHDVTTDGSETSKTTSSITVKSISDIAQIHNMYTP